MYEGQYFKNIKYEDYTITPFTTYKQWSFVPTSYSDAGISISYGNILTGSFTTSSEINDDGTYKNLVYSVIDNNYYRYSENFELNISPNIVRTLNNKLILFGIPQQKYGEVIKPNTFELLYSTYTIVDDGYGNLIDSSNSNFHIGNIFYEDGTVVITDTGSYYNNFDSSSFTNFTYNGQHKIYQHEAICRIGQGELNSTINRTLFEANENLYWSSSNVEPLIYVKSGNSWSGSNIFKIDEFAPYVTTIGLYNEDSECLVIGRLAKPIKNDKNINLAFTIRFDM